VVVLEEGRTLASTEEGGWNTCPRMRRQGTAIRLEEVLAKMVEDGVLRATRTAKGAFVYSPGLNYEQYRRAAA